MDLRVNGTTIAIEELTLIDSISTVAKSLIFTYTGNLMQVRNMFHIGDIVELTVGDTNLAFTIQDTKLSVGGEDSFIIVNAECVGSIVGLKASPKTIQYKAGTAISLVMQNSFDIAVTSTIGNTAIKEDFIVKQGDIASHTLTDISLDKDAYIKTDDDVIELQYIDGSAYRMKIESFDSVEIKESVPVVVYPVNDGDFSKEFNMQNDFKKDGWYTDSRKIKYLYNDFNKLSRTLTKRRYRAENKVSVTIVGNHGYIPINSSVDVESVGIIDYVVVGYELVINGGDYYYKLELSE